jgi:ABC-type enterochelin transport system permease subunit
MKNIRIRKSIIIAVALSGAVLNAVYSIDLLRAFFDPHLNNAIREILISAVVLEIGWVTLLVWVVIKPLERRHILLVTIVPILLGNILHSVNQFGTYNGNASAILLNTSFGLLYSGLYVVAFIVGNGAKQ